MFIHCLWIPLRISLKDHGLDHVQLSTSLPSSSFLLSSFLSQVIHTQTVLGIIYYLGSRNAGKNMPYLSDWGLFLPKYLPKAIKSLCTHKQHNTNIYSGFVNLPQTLEQTKCVQLGKWISSERLAHGISLSSWKEPTWKHANTLEDCKGLQGRD